MVKNLLAVQGMQVQSLVWEDPLEQEIATHSRILARKIPWTKEPGGLQSTGSQRVRYEQVTKHKPRELRDDIVIIHQSFVNSFSGVNPPVYTLLFPLLKS